MNQRKKFFSFISCIIFFLSSLPAIAAWQHLPLSGGFVHAIVSCGNRLLAATDAEIWRSTDDGASWTPSSNGIVTPDVEYMTTLGSDIYAVSNWQLFHSADAGDNWAAMSVDPSAQVIGNVVTAGQNLLIATDSGLFRSVDKGATWNIADTSLTGYMYSVCADSNVVIAGRYFELKRSTDFGAHWTPCDVGSPTVFCLWHNATTLFDATDQGICSSTDGGATWTDASVLHQDNWNNASVAIVGQTMFLTSPRGSYSNYERLCIVCSRDNGATWQTDSTSFSTPGVTTLYAFKNIFIAGMYGAGIYRSLDTGNTWQQSNTGLFGAYVETLSPIDNKLYAGCGGSLQMSTDQGASWLSTTRTFDAYEFWVMRFVKHAPYVYAATYTGVYRSADQGATWLSATANLSGYGYSYLAEHGDYLYAGGTEGLIKSRDQGVNWINTNQSLTSLLFDATALQVIDNKIIVGGWGANISTDSGLTWQPLYIGRLNPTIHDFEYSNGNVVASTDSGVFISPDSGYTWNDITSGLPSYEDISAVAIRDSNVFAALDHRTYVDSNTTLIDPRGLFLSTDLGASWQLISDSLPSAYITTIALDADNIYIGMTGAGSSVWSKPLSELPISAEKPLLIYPQNMALNVPTNTTAEWTSISNATIYHVAVAKDISFEQPVFDTIVTSTNVALRNLAPNNSYYWMVTARRSAGDSVASSVNLFTTGTSSVSGGIIVAGSSLMATVSPSPAANLATIEYTLPMASHVTLDICDMAGNVVRSIYSGYGRNGVSRRTIDVSSLPADSYYCRVHSAVGTAVSKFTIVH